MKPLIEKGILLRLTRKQYSLDVNTIKSILSSKTQQLSSDLKNIKNFENDFSNIMSKIASNKSTTSATYVDSNDYFSTIAKFIKSSEKIIIHSTHFPNIAYPLKLSESLGRKVYHTNLMEALETGIEITYFTGFDVKIPYTRFMSLYKNSRKSSKETLKIINNFEEIIESYDNISVKYLEKLVGAPLFILESKLQKLVFLSLRWNQIIQGNVSTNKATKGYPGVYISSQKVVEDVKTSFSEFFNESIDMRSKEGKEIIENSKLTLQTQIDAR